jgi:hypothetical protein
MSLLLLLIHLSGSLIAVTLCLLDEVSNGLLQIVNTIAHLINAAYNVVAHGLESALHLGEHLLHKLRELIGRAVSTTDWCPTMHLLVLVHLTRRIIV